MISMGSQKIKAHKSLDLEQSCEKEHTKLLYPASSENKSNQNRFAQFFAERKIPKIWTLTKVESC